MSRWFRMYNEALDDPKVQSLNGNDFKGWVNILLLACRHDGVLPSFDDVVFSLRLNPPTAAKLVKTLISNGLLDQSQTKDSVGSPHGWNNRQYKSDVSTERVKRFRNGKRGVSETAPDTETETDTDTETDFTVPRRGGSSYRGTRTRGNLPADVIAFERFGGDL